MNDLTKTIAAISTARGKGGIAVIRISGTDARRVAETMCRVKFTKKYGENLTDHPARMAVYVDILDADDEVCDVGMATCFVAPHSFTGEDMVEISCHGGPAVTEAVYLSALAHGASSAGPGEFTRRGFINGKMSLTEAEAVGLLIDADTNERRKLSSGALRGNVSHKIDDIYNGLLDVMTALYAAIDYPEEGVEETQEEHITSVLCDAEKKVSALLGTYNVGRAISDGVRCTICGKPNAGKSSLFNLITGEKSAIVTSIEGTTRDVLRETVSFGGVTLRLSDTAGIRDASDEVEKIGIERAYGEIENAELILEVYDTSREFSAEDREMMEKCRAASGRRIAVLNKADLADKFTDEEKREIRDSVDALVVMSAGDEVEKSDISALHDAVAELFGSDKIELTRDAVIWDVRQREMLTHAASALRSAVIGMTESHPIDAICTTVEEAMSALAETDGRGVEDNIISEIFKRFCVGK